MKKRKKVVEGTRNFPTSTSTTTQQRQTIQPSVQRKNKKPEWNLNVHDLEAMRIGKREAERRKQLFISKHAQEVHEQMTNPQSQPQSQPILQGGEELEEELEDEEIVGEIREALSQLERIMTAEEVQEERTVQQQQQQQPQQKRLQPRQREIITGDEIDEEEDKMRKHLKKSPRIPRKIPTIVTQQQEVESDFVDSTRELREFEESQKRKKKQTQLQTQQRTPIRTRSPIDEIPKPKQQQQQEKREEEQQPIPISSASVMISEERKGKRILEEALNESAKLIRRLEEALKRGNEQLGREIDARQLIWKHLQEAREEISRKNQIIEEMHQQIEELSKLISENHQFGFHLFIHITDNKKKHR